MTKEVLAIFKKVGGPKGDFIYFYRVFKIEDLGTGMISVRTNEEFDKLKVKNPDVTDRIFGFISDDKYIARDISTLKSKGSYFSFDKKEDTYIIKLILEHGLIKGVEFIDARTLAISRNKD